jgi:hypothetical protein
MYNFFNPPSLSLNTVKDFPNPPSACPI